MSSNEEMMQSWHLLLRDSLQILKTVLTSSILSSNWTIIWEQYSLQARYKAYFSQSSTSSFFVKLSSSLSSQNLSSYYPQSRVVFSLLLASNSLKIESQIYKSLIFRFFSSSFLSIIKLAPGLDRLSYEDGQQSYILHQNLLILIGCLTLSFFIDRWDFFTDQFFSFPFLKDRYLQFGYFIEAAALLCFISEQGGFIPDILLSFLSSSFFLFCLCPLPSNECCPSGIACFGDDFWLSSGDCSRQTRSSISKEHCSEAFSLLRQINSWEQKDFIQ